MAKYYFERITTLIHELNLTAEIESPIEVRHFFSGAALYVDDSIRVTWTPVGLAFKLPDAEVSELIGSGKAKPLKYFPKGFIKKGYALFENPESREAEYWKSYLLRAAQEF